MIAVWISLLSVAICVVAVLTLSARRRKQLGGETATPNVRVVRFVLMALLMLVAFLLLLIFKH
jgi:hypothetical protein